MALSWTACLALGAVLGAAALLFFYLYLLMFYDEDKKLQDARKSKAREVRDIIFEKKKREMEANGSDGKTIRALKKSDIFQLPDDFKNRGGGDDSQLERASSKASTACPLGEEDGAGSWADDPLGSSTENVGGPTSSVRRGTNTISNSKTRSNASSTAPSPIDEFNASYKKSLQHLMASHQNIIMNQKKSASLRTDAANSLRRRNNNKGATVGGGTPASTSGKSSPLEVDSQSGGSSHLSEFNGLASDMDERRIPGLPVSDSSDRVSAITKLSNSVWTAEEREEKKKISEMVDQLTLDNAGDYMRNIDVAVKEEVRRMREASALSSGDETKKPLSGRSSEEERQVELLYRKYKELKDKLNLVEGSGDADELDDDLDLDEDDIATNAPPTPVVEINDTMRNNLAWRQSDRVKMDENALRDRTRNLFTALKAAFVKKDPECKPVRKMIPGKNPDEITALLKQLNSVFDAIQNDPNRPAAVTKQIVFCNELMNHEGLSLLQQIRDRHTQSIPCGKLAADLMEKAVPVIWSS